MTFPIDHSASANVQTTNTGATASGGSTAASPLSTTSGAQDVLESAGGTTNYSFTSGGTNVQIPDSASYFQNMSAQEISSYISNLQSSLQSAQAAAGGSASTSGSSSTSGDGLKAAKGLDKAWADFQNADPDKAEDYQKKMQAYQRAMEFFRMALQMMIAAHEAKKATAQGIRY